MVWIDSAILQILLTRWVIYFNPAGSEQNGWRRHSIWIIYSPSLRQALASTVEQDRYIRTWRERTTLFSSLHHRVWGFHYNFDVVPNNDKRSKCPNLGTSLWTLFKCIIPVFHMVYTNVGPLCIVDLLLETPSNSEKTILIDRTRSNYIFIVALRDQLL